MKKSWALLLASALIATGWMLPGEAVVVMLNQDGVVYNSRQPLQAFVIDSNGNNIQQTVYYDPALGGVDLNTSWAGPNASVYFPTLNTGYVWYNGYWVNPEGYYWNGGNRIYVGPSWNNYWTGYWGKHNYWNGDWRRGERHGADWHRADWHGGEINRADWHGGGDVRHDEWRAGDARRGEFHDAGVRGGDRGRR